MLADCQNEEDRRIIEFAYQEFMSILQPEKEKKQKKIKRKAETSSESDQSMILEEDGGPRIECKQLLRDPKLMERFIKAISKKLQSYT
jgi:hypothetical protein